MGELLEAVAEGRVIEHRNVAGQGAGDFSIDFVTAFLQLCHAGFGIGLRTGGHLAEQVEQQQQPRLGADEASRFQLTQPCDDPFHGGHQVVTRFIGATRIEFP